MIIFKSSAKLHVLIEEEHNLEACTFSVDQDQAFEAGFQMKVNCL
jgi:hypothetical protein